VSTNVRQFIPADITASRHRGSPESVAANPTREAKSQSHQLILAHLRQFGPMTCKELAHAMGTEMHCISGRLVELKMSGSIRKTLFRGDGGAVLEVAR